MAKQINYADMGSRLKEIRKHLNIQQKVMAQTLEIQASYLCDIEAGKGNPGPDFFIKLSSQYNINLHYLLMGSGDMFIRTGPQKVKTEEFDLSAGIDTIEKVAWLFEKSLFFKSMVLGACIKILYTEKEILKNDIKKNKSRAE
ncbi:MAG: helix-turn-helix transcriptional regulator [Candidatus Aminicenantes bacterium]|nr:helix-turn-helix transcriptional regulator [Candidatus Aminicenantes bacterium]